jgi:hypothetical protein
VFGGGVELAVLDWNLMSMVNFFPDYLLVAVILLCSSIIVTTTIFCAPNYGFPGNPLF